MRIMYEVGGVGVAFPSLDIVCTRLVQSWKSAVFFLLIKKDNQNYYSLLLHTPF